MTSVREATFELLRSHGMTGIFGNPGSTELGMLKDFPEDFSYVLGLQELVVVGMADGFAQASGTVGHANLHTAPGVGNAIGGIFNARANKAPLLVTGDPGAVCEVEPRAAACAGRPAGDRARDPPRVAAAAWPGVRVDPDGRLGSGGG
jgi:benzoylformate decarboxylase